MRRRLRLLGAAPVLRDRAGQRLLRLRLGAGAQVRLTLAGQRLDRARIGRVAVRELREGARGALGVLALLVHHGHLERDLLDVGPRLEAPRVLLVVADRAVVLVHGRIRLEGDASDLAADPARLEAAYLGSDDTNDPPNQSEDPKEIR